MIDAKALIAEAQAFDTAPAEYSARLRGAHSLIERLAAEVTKLDGQLTEALVEVKRLVNLPAMTDPTTREALRRVIARYDSSAARDEGLLDVILASGYRPAHEVADTAIEVVSKTLSTENNDQWSKGVQWAENHAVASIRAAFPAPTEEPTKILAGFDATPAAQPYSLTEEPKP